MQNGHRSLRYRLQYRYSLSPFVTHTAAAGIVRSVDIHAPLHAVAKSVGLCVCVCVCRKVYCGKTAEWIRMPFGIVSGVSQMMGVLHGVVIVEWEEAVLG